MTAEEEDTEQGLEGGKTNSMGHDDAWRDFVPWI
jgi:hypothetical protein